MTLPWNAKQIGRGYPSPIQQQQAPANPAPGSAATSGAGGPDSGASLPGLSNPAGSAGQAAAPKPVKVYTLALDNARADERQDWRGSFIWCISGSSTTVTASIRLASLENDPIPFVQGRWLGGVPFDKVFITNSAQAGGTLKFVVIEDSPGDAVIAGN